MSVTYKIPENIRNLTAVCYNPSADVDGRFVTMKLADYVANCEYLLMTDERPRLILFHITFSKADADDAILRMTKVLSDLRHDRQVAPDPKQTTTSERPTPINWTFKRQNKRQASTA